MLTHRVRKAHSEVHKSQQLMFNQALLAQGLLSEGFKLSEGSKLSAVN